MKKRMFSIVDGRTSIYFNHEEIVYAKSDGNYLTIYFVGRKEKIILASMKRIFCSSAEEQCFFRCHRSYFVNLSHVLELNETKKVLLMSNGETVSISEANIAGFKLAMNCTEI